MMLCVLFRFFFSSDGLWVPTASKCHRASCRTLSPLTLVRVYAGQGRSSHGLVRRLCRLEGCFSDFVLAIVHCLFYAILAGVYLALIFVALPHVLVLAQGASLVGLAL
jgi:hypothetical protein